MSTKDIPFIYGPQPISDIPENPESSRLAWYTTEDQTTSKSVFELQTIVQQQASTIIELKEEIKWLKDTIDTLLQKNTNK
jgi:hypothetical protein